MPSPPSPATRKPGPTDIAVLTWISRFRFVTAQLVAERFGVSIQMTRRRLRRLEHEGHIGRHRAVYAQEYAVYITGKGAAKLGLPQRRTPRTEVQREHELAIAWLASRIERATGATVLTERECRRIESTSRARRSVEIWRTTGRSDRRRWPDLVVEHENRLIAVEIEFAPKGSPRLAAIVDAYFRSELFHEVRFLMSDPPTAARLSRIVTIERGHAAARALSATHRTQVIVSPWTGAPDADRTAVTDAIAKTNSS